MFSDLKNTQKFVAARTDAGEPSTSHSDNQPPCMTPMEDPWSWQGAGEASPLESRREVTAALHRPAVKALRSPRQSSRSINQSPRESSRSSGCYRENEPAGMVCGFGRNCAAIAQHIEKIVAAFALYNAPQTQLVGTSFAHNQRMVVLSIAVAACVGVGTLLIRIDVTLLKFIFFFLKE